VFGSEAVYAPKPGANRQSAEDDGYVITLVTDSNNWQSHCLVFDATAIERGPLARVKMPHRVPLGFHATWARGEDFYRQG
jgi:carotenoid cleavage dioxygenase